MRYELKNPEKFNFGVCANSKYELTEALKEVLTDNSAEELSDLVENCEGRQFVDEMSYTDCKEYLTENFDESEDKEDMLDSLEDSINALEGYKNPKLLKIARDLKRVKELLNLSLVY